MPIEIWMRNVTENQTERPNVIAKKSETETTTRLQSGSSTGIASHSTTVIWTASTIVIVMQNATARQTVKQSAIAKTNEIEMKRS